MDRKTRMEKNEGKGREERSRDCEKNRGKGGREEGEKRGKRGKGEEVSAPNTLTPQHPREVLPSFDPPIHWLRIDLQCDQRAHETHGATREPRVSLWLLRASRELRETGQHDLFHSRQTG